MSILKPIKGLVSPVFGSAEMLSNYVEDSLEIQKSLREDRMKMRMQDAKNDLLEDMASVSKERKKLLNKIGSLETVNQEKESFNALYAAMFN